jgi:hypothetical protein
LQAVLDAHGALQMHYVGWHVDPTNPAWSAVRAAAIKDAIVRARDYARSLGGELVGIEQVADVGLLGGPNQGGGPRVFAAAAGAISAVAGAPAAPHLDPVPQLLSAAIEARFNAGKISLHGI